MNKIIGMIIREEMLEVIWQHINIFEDRIEEDIKDVTGMRIITEKEVEIGLEKNIQTIIGEMGGSRASTNRDKIRCYKCREYVHFAKDCPTSKEKRKIEQIQNMFNLDEGTDIIIKH